MTNSLNIIFDKITILFAASVILGFITVRWRQPLILAYIIIGILAGPLVLAWITPNSDIALLASFGMTVLLFVVGLKLDLTLIMKYGTVTFLAGIGQIILTTIIGTLLGICMGMHLGSALFVAFALTFSSTIIIVQMLINNSETYSLHGSITIGILIVQDIIVLLAIVALSSLSNHQELYAHPVWETILLITKWSAFIALFFVVRQFILPWFLQIIAESRELLILFALTWTAFFGVICQSLGISNLVGGLLAGISLSSSQFRDAIVSKLEPINNLLLIFFFLNMGASLRFHSFGSGMSNIVAEIVPIIVFSIFVIIGKPLITMIFMTYRHFKKRTSFMSAIIMGQVSEFSLILIMLGLQLELINNNVASLIVLVSFISIGISSYIMQHANGLYHSLSPYLGRFERDVNRRTDPLRELYNFPIDIIIYGFGRHGEYLAKILEKNGFNIMGVDFDPRKIHSHLPHKILVRFGDAEDGEFPKTLPLNGIKWLISTVAPVNANEILVSALREVGYKGKIAVSAYHENDLERLKKLNVDLIIVPYQDAAASVAERIMKDAQGTPPA